MTGGDPPGVLAPLRAPPLSDARTSPYWEGFQEREIRLPTCHECERYHWHPRSVCPHCGSTSVRWSPVSGRAEVYTWVRVGYHFDLPFLEDAVPFDAGLVVPTETTDIKLPALLTVPEGDSPAIGMAVEAEFHRDSESDLVAPVYVPV